MTTSQAGVQSFTKLHIFNTSSKEIHLLFADSLLGQGILGRISSRLCTLLVLHSFIG
jgi:hypothetical protein